MITNKSVYNLAKLMDSFDRKYQGFKLGFRDTSFWIKVESCGYWVESKLPVKFEKDEFNLTFNINSECVDAEMDRVSAMIEKIRNLEISVSYEDSVSAEPDAILNLNLDLESLKDHLENSDYAYAEIIDLDDGTFCFTYTKKGGLIWG